MLMSWERQMDHQGQEQEKEKEELVMEDEKQQDQDHFYHRDDDEDDHDDFQEEESSTSGGASSRRRREQQQVPRWDKFLGKGSLTVLLVEGDDSTRHVIAALLRKCNYKVAAVSDVIKAWEILKERPQRIDVVLAEVEVPSVSGINLLSMIMEHEICKQIPVIMMSSHDSINMVFKCMLKGAADFLVKPIRRNELRNLWQHVWRRHTSRDGHGGTKLNQDDNANNKIEATSRKGNLTSGFVPYVKNNKECSEKGSDAQSSCTRSDMEAESTYKQNSLEPQQTTCKGFPVLRDRIRHNAEEKIQPNRSLLDHVCKHEGYMSIMLGSECTPFNETSIANEQLLEEECSCALVGTANKDVKPMGALYNNSITNEMEGQIYDQGTPPKQIIDLLGAIDNQQQFGYRIRENTATSNNLYDAPEVVFHDEDFSYKSSSAPFLELSLRRYPHANVGKEEKIDCSTLNHSDSSAFSLYTSRASVSTLPRTVNLQAEGEEYYSPSTKQIPDEGFGNCSNVPRCTGTAQHINTEDAESPSPGASSKNRIAIKCFPIRVIPIPIPVGGMNFDSVMQPFLRPESSGHPLWSSGSSKGQEAVCMNVSHQSDTKETHICHQHPLSQSPKSPILYTAQMEHGKLNSELREEPWHVACAPGDSASGSICYGSAGHHHIDSNGLGRTFNGSNGNISHVAAELRNQEEKKSAELYRLNQREAALNKFRLKRKERCYEKKVRYQSRKRLAEQRPRVKGQFVRHIQPDASSVEAAACQVEPAVG